VREERNEVIENEGSKSDSEVQSGLKTPPGKMMERSTPSIRRVRVY